MSETNKKEIKRVEINAQIKILAFLLDHLCVGELPEAGRRAVKKLINDKITEKEK